MTLLRVAPTTLKASEVALLALAVGGTDGERTAKLLNAYEANETWTLYVHRRKQRTVGIVGCETLAAAKTARIRHIAVDPTVQRVGLGRRMIEALFRQLDFSVLRAETDSDAVEFYRACGFTVETLGETYPGVERFECVLQTKGEPWP